MAGRMNWTLSDLHPTPTHSVTLCYSCKKERTSNLKALSERWSHLHGLDYICHLMAQHDGHLIPWRVLGIGPKSFPLCGKASSPAPLLSCSPPLAPCCFGPQPHKEAFYVSVKSIRTFCAGVHSRLLWLMPGLHRLLLRLASGLPWTHSVYWVHVGWRNPSSVLAFFL